MVDDLAGDGDGTAVRDVTGGGEERNLGLRVLKVLGIGCQGSPEFVRRS
jgi:hypothetical protein